MAGYGDGRSIGRVLRAVCLAFVLVVFVWFLSMGIIASEENKGRTVTTSTSYHNHMHNMLQGRKRHSVPVTFDPFYATKRRVPSGPDPIHNRHVGATTRPPDRA